MQTKLFTIPVIGGEKLEEEMNAFLRSRKILQSERHFVSNAQGTFWCFCITYIEGTKPKSFKSSSKEKPDFEKLLDKQTFRRFSRLREIRKKLSDADGIPAYAVFTNAELVEIAKLGEEVSLAKMEKIRGVGKRKLEKYGHHFINKNEASE